MEFVNSSKMKITVSKEQEKMLSSKEKIQKYISDKHYMAFDIIKGNDVIGFLLLRKFEEGAFFLRDYAIDIQFQNQHYGTEAIKEFIIFMNKNYNMNTLTTTYIYGNTHAKHIYEKVGFVETSVVDENGVHEVNMKYKV